MSPVTQYRSRRKASSSKHTLDEQPQDFEDSTAGEDDAQDIGSTLQAHIRQALEGAKRLQRENEELRRENEGLRKEVKSLRQEVDEQPIKPKRGGKTAASVSQLSKEVKTLRNQVRTLEKSKQRCLKRIDELSMKEVKRDADELVEDAEFEGGDSGHTITMRKLLREFHDLMLAAVLGPDDDGCAICFEPLQLEKCSSLPCQHIFCTEPCLQKLPSDAESDVESIRCPTCRKVCRRDQLESVEMTSTQQWDKLLHVAWQWAKIDMHRDDTSEEEGEEDFIDDEGTNDATTTVSEQEQSNPLDTSPEPEDTAAEPQVRSRMRKRIVVSPDPEDLRSPEHSAPGGPGPAANEEQLGTLFGEPGPSTETQPTYSQAPREGKRKMLEELAEARSKKPRL
ncbi:hypothetical protein K466DRAFT_583318 [Polyporus arcularius HHB13444]|uniref:RING-type domain-containing protein n=1 Tax=Polyporus arcularius HHB13444 TaxID=1314778 RepID=A0A5C3PMA2_9APHY|nr:hypothetical protein K466DRAFT_583318 [Polyporus arcularius HHB13444]